MLVVLGASGGVGNALVRYVCRNGLAEKYGGVFGSYRDNCNVESEDSVATFFANIPGIDASGGPLYVVNATGFLANGLLRDVLDKDILKTLDVNVAGSARVLKHFYAAAKDRPGSAVVMLSSVVATRGAQGAALYGAAKGAVSAMVKTAALEFAKVSLRVNCIRMGYFNVGMIDRIPGKIQDKIKQDIPMHRFGRIDDLYPVIEAAMFSRYMTGSCLDVNGGLS